MSLCAALVLAAGTDARAMTVAWIDQNAEALKRVNQAVWSYAETGLVETKSAGFSPQGSRARGARTGGPGSRVTRGEGQAWA